MLQLRIICHHRPPWASTSPSCPQRAWFPGRRESQGKQFSSGFSQKLSSYHEMDANFQYINPCDSWFLLNLKHQMCKGKPAVINRVPGARGAWETSHKPPDFCPKLQGSKTDKSRSGSVSEIWMHDTVNALHVHSYNFWECFWLPIKIVESLDYILITSVFCFCFWFFLLLLDNTKQLSQVVVVRSLSRVWLFVTPWTTALQVSLSFTIFWTLLKFMFTEDMSQDEREK